MPTNGLQLMSVADIMQLAAGSVDIANKNGEVDWWGIFSAKVSAGHFDSIVDEIQAHGFGMPIVLCDRYYDGNYVIGNGHHRLAAAILMGLWRIPVIVSQGGNRSDFMQPHDSMDDYERPIGYAGTYEYWNMLQGNMEKDGWNAAGDESEDHPQFYCEYSNRYYNNSTHCCTDCHNMAEHPYCDYCEQRNCDDDHNPVECEHCGAVDAGDWSDHLIGCPEYDWHIVECVNGRHYAFFACGPCRDSDHEDALSEDYGYEAEKALYISVGAMYPDGAWHPFYILEEAYQYDADWEAGRELREARRYWELTVHNLRNAIADGCGDAVISAYAADVYHAREQLRAL